MAERKNVILLVEDNPGDVRLAQEILSNSVFNTHMVAVYNGDDAITYLQQATITKTLPSLIILDLNLPRRNGIEVLKIIKQDAKLKLIPVVILTSSAADNDINLSYQNHANLYIAKPVDFDEYFKVISNIEKFWFSIAKLPD